MQKRPDDNEKTIKNRFGTYISETLPVLDHYRDQKLLYEIEGKGDIYEVYKEIHQIIYSLET